MAKSVEKAAKKKAAPKKAAKKKAAPKKAAKKAAPQKAAKKAAPKKQLRKNRHVNQTPHLWIPLNVSDALAKVVGTKPSPRTESSKNLGLH